MRSTNDAKSIFLAAVELSLPAERKAYLDDACGGDAALRQRVEALLRAHDEPESYLEPPLVERAQAEELPTIPLPPISEKPGTTIGPYKLLEQIGEGGFGVVYMAEQAEPVRRRVALKIIKPGMDSRQVIVRFEAERQALAMMDHQNIARVLDAGTTDSGRPYFVMELVRGVPITQYCDAHKLTVRERLALFIPVCQAIQHAHQKGIIHRDVKPSNILVCLYDGKATPKVIDFGVAKAIDQRLTEKTMFTQHGQIIGTLEYMSPEQAELSQLDVDTRSDIYSLGVLLYELLTGMTPITKEQLRSAGFAEMLCLIREMELEKPSTRLSHSHKLLPVISAQRQTEPSKLGAILRGELDWIVMKALEKDRMRRYETANALARDIDRHLADEPVEACPPSTAYRMRKFVRKHRTAISTAAGFAGILALAAVVSTWQAIRATNAEAGALVERDRAQQSELQAKVAQERAREERDLAERARVQEVAARQEAEQARQAEAAQKTRLAEQTRQLERQLYFNRVTLAQAQWSTNNINTAEKLLDSGSADLRGYEWYYVKRLCHKDIMTLRHEDGLDNIDVAFLMDGTRVISVGRGTLKVWDSKTEVLLTEESGESFRIACLSANGKWLAARHLNDQSISVLDTETDRVAAIIRDDAGGYALTLSLDGSTLAVSNQNTIVLWDVLSASERLTIRSPLFQSPGIQCLAFSADGQRIAGGYTGGGFRVWDTMTGKQVLVAPAYEGSVQDLTFSADGKYLATAQFEGTATIWDLAKGQPFQRLRGHSSAVRAVAFSPNCQRLATASADRSVRLWDVQYGTEEVILRGHRGEVTSVAFSPDSQLVVSGSQDGTVKIWSADTHQETLLLRGHARDSIPAIAFQEGGRRLASVGADNTLRIWDSFTGENVRTLSAGKWPIALLGNFLFIRRSSGFGDSSGSFVELMGVAFSADGRYLATDVEDAIAIWDATTGRRLRLIGEPSKEIPTLAWSPDGQRLASATTRPVFGEVGKQLCEINLWDPQTGELLQKLSTQELAITRLAYSPDGQCVAGGGRKEVNIWNASAGRQMQSLSSQSSGATASIAFSADGAILAAGETDGVVTIWDTSSGGVVVSLRAHDSSVTALAFSPDSQRLATGGEDRAVKLWETVTGEAALTLRVEAPKVESLAFSPDGHRLAASSTDGVIRIWDATPLAP
jgi:WD40 repeat protein/serine/threonine protein kinase